MKKGADAPASPTETQPILMARTFPSEEALQLSLELEGSNADACRYQKLPCRFNFFTGEVFDGILCLGCKENFDAKCLADGECPACGEKFTMTHHLVREVGQ